MQLCTCAIGTIGDICRALGEASAQYCGHFMTALFEDLSSQTVNRNIKIPIMSCFGDIAYAITGSFEPYLQPCMEMLKQAGELMADPVRLRIVMQLCCANSNMDCRMTSIWSTTSTNCARVSSKHTSEL